ncbi:MAG: DUF4249 family protein [Flavobacteriaceae bacterium]|nr:DUF4249 family protein [Flavobacteriaceae bacterium]
MKKPLLILMLSALIFSCDDVVDTEIVSIEQTIYISSFISPEIDSLRVNISRTLPALGLEINTVDPEQDLERFLIKDAEVRISNSAGASVQLPYNAAQFQYAESTNQLPIVPGETYLLIVEAEGRTYTANYTVPLDNIAAIDQQIRVSTDEFGFSTYDLDIGFIDIPDEDNFYVVGAFLDVPSEENLGFVRTIGFELEAFQTDNLRDGREIGANTEFFPDVIFNDAYEPEIVEQDLVMQVMLAERPLFNLLRANYLNDTNEGDPFLELSVEPNTIRGEGGTGIFAAYRYFEKRLALQEEF